MASLLVHLAARLRERRIELRLSTLRAARQAGVKWDAWHAWEKAQARPSERNWTGIEEVLQWRTGSVEALLAQLEPTPADLFPPPDYRDAVTGETYEDPIERGLWDLRHAMAEPYVVTYGPERARELGEADAREHIDGHRRNQARLRRMTEPGDANPAQVA